jgi:hypothetical protein
MQATRSANSAFKPRRSGTWTAERVAQLDRKEVEQLRSNATALGEESVVALCDEALRALPKGSGKAATAARTSAAARRLISRGKAFEARGVHLEDARTSWGGVRKADGVVVLGLWAQAVKSRDGVCNYLLWGPNVDGSRPWYDSAAGQERLKHCRLVAEGANAEGLLVHGEELSGHLPEDKARTVHGVDPETIVLFKVEKHDEEYWAVWGKAAA